MTSVRRCDLRGCDRAADDMGSTVGCNSLLESCDCLVSRCRLRPDIPPVAAAFFMPPGAPFSMHSAHLR